jgi:hypothetical protein
VEALYRARQDHFCGGASGMTELEAALAAFCIEHGLSQAQRQDLCNLHFHRGLISAGLAPRMDGHSQAAMVPAFEEVCLNFDEADVQNFGPLKVWVRDIVSVMWYMLCDPAVHLPTDLAKQYEELYDPECVAGNDPCRGAMSPDICNSLWFKHAYARVPKGFLLHPIIFSADGTVCGKMNGRNVHAMFAANGAMRTSARNKAPGMRLIGLLIPPTGGAGLVAAGTEALKLRSNRYFQQVLHHFGEALRAIGQHGVTLPLPLNGQLETWERQKCALLLMGFCGDVEERPYCEPSVPKVQHLRWPRVARAGGDKPDEHCRPDAAASRAEKPDGGQRLHRRMRGCSSAGWDGDPRTGCNACKGPARSEGR